MDQLSTRIDPLGQSEHYAYDANGNLTTFTDRKGAGEYIHLRRAESSHGGVVCSLIYGALAGLHL